MAVPLSGIGLSTSIIGYIVSAVLVSIVIKFFLDKLRMFSSPTANWVLSILIAFSGMYFAKIPFSIVSTLFIFLICILKISGFKRFLIGIFLTGAYVFFVLPHLLSFLS